MFSSLCPSCLPRSTHTHFFTLPHVPHAPAISSSWINCFRIIYHGIQIIKVLMQVSWANFFPFHFKCVGWVSTVGVVTWYGLGGLGIKSRWEWNSMMVLPHYLVVFFCSWDWNDDFTMDMSLLYFTFSICCKWLSISISFATEEL